MSLWALGALYQYRTSAPQTAQTSSTSPTITHQPSAGLEKCWPTHFDTSEAAGSHADIQCFPGNLGWRSNFPSLNMAMQDALQPFQTAYASRQPMLVAQFLSPVPPSHDPGRLYDFWRATREDKILGDIGYALESGVMSRGRETDAWVDIIACYWRAVDKILKAEQAQNQGRVTERQMVDVYDAWKDLTSNFIKYISNGVLPHWTVFTLYFIANSLRKTAIKADEQLARAKPVAFNAGFQDDVVGATARNEKLEEAARVFNRIFALCLGDRYALR